MLPSSPQNPLFPLNRLRADQTEVRGRGERSDPGDDQPRSIGPEPAERRGTIGGTISSGECSGLRSARVVIAGTRRDRTVPDSEGGASRRRAPPFIPCAPDLRGLLDGTVHVCAVMPRARRPIRSVAYTPGTPLPLPSSRSPSVSVMPSGVVPLTTI